MSNHIQNLGRIRARNFRTKRRLIRESERESENARADLQETQEENQPYEEIINLKKSKNDSTFSSEEDVEEEKQIDDLYEESSTTFVNQERNEANNLLPHDTESTETDLTVVTKKDLNGLERNLIKYFKNISDDMKGLNSKLISMEKDIQDTKRFVYEQRPFRDQENIIQIEKIEEIFETELPLITYDDFNIFDQKIVGDAYTHLKNYFNCNINTTESNILSKVMTPIFKQFFLKEVLKEFTAQKKQSTKHILKQTNFYKCFLEAMQHAYNNPEQPKKITSNSLSVFIGGLLNNAKDWKGGRLKRKRLTSDDDNV